MNVSFEAPSPIFETGLHYLESGTDLLLALCLNNGYYNRENIYRMLTFALSFSKRVQVFTTDGPAKHNYRAFGKPEDEVIRDTRLARNRLRNQCNAGLARFNAHLPLSEHRTITFLDWASIYKDAAYQISYQNLKNLYHNRADFKKDIDQTSAHVLLTRIGITKNVEAVLPIAIKYVLEELAFILSYQRLSPENKPFADHGANGFNYIYYESWPVFENLANGEYDNQRKEGIGFVIAKIQDVKQAVKVRLVQS